MNEEHGKGITVDADGERVLVISPEPPPPLPPAPRRMPVQGALGAKQNYETPNDFFDAVVARFGVMSHDLAAEEANTKTTQFFNEATDSLKQDWAQIKRKGLNGKPIMTNLWLNPPFAHIKPWAEKCAAYQGHGQVFLLVPAAVGARWFARHVFGRARVIFLAPRLCFDGKDPYPKDCMLCVFGPKVEPGFEVWDWENDRRLVHTATALAKVAHRVGVTARKSSKVGTKRG